MRCTGVVPDGSLRHYVMHADGCFVLAGTKSTTMVFVWLRIRPGTSSGVIVDLSVSSSNSVSSVNIKGTASMPWRWERFAPTQQSEAELAISLSPRHGVLELDKLVVTREALWRPPID